MNATTLKLLLFITLSFVLALMLNVYPLSPSLAMIRPMFLIMVLIFWAIHTPHMVGVGIAFVIGLFADLLMDTHLGHQAFCAVLTVFGLKLALLASKRLTLHFLCVLGMAGLVFFCTLLWVLQSVAYTKLVFTGFGSLVISLFLFAPLTFILARIPRHLGIALES